MQSQNFRFALVLWGSMPHWTEEQTLLFAPTLSPSLWFAVTKIRIIFHTAITFCLFFASSRQECQCAHCPGSGEHNLQSTHWSPWFVYLNIATLFNSFLLERWSAKSLRIIFLNSRIIRANNDHGARACLALQSKVPRSFFWIPWSVFFSIIPIAKQSNNWNVFCNK